MGVKKMYEFTDRIISILNKKLIEIFSRLKTQASFDEMHTLQSVRAVYAEADDLVRQYLLVLAQNIYLEHSDEEKTNINGLWLFEILNAYDPVTQYVYINEIERKRARLFESLVASTNKSKEIDTALRYFSSMMRQYALTVSDKAVLQAYKDNGEQKVKWITTPDDRRCVECAKRDGKIYDIDKIPPKPHLGCRCILIPLDN